MNSEGSYVDGNTDQRTMENLEDRKGFVSEPGQRHCLYFLRFGSKELSFPRTYGEQDLESKGRWSWCCFIAVFEGNSLSKNIPAPDINICGIFIVLYHPCFCFFPVVWITEPRGRRELFDSGTHVPHVLHILFHLLMLFLDY